MPRWSRRCAVFSCFAFSAFVDRVICHKYITSYDDNQRLVKISNHQLLRDQIGSHLLCTGSDYPTYTKENFQFERKISGWRSKGKLDYRRKEYYSYVTWRDPRRRRKRKG